jgi:hypothetical protein
MSVHSPLLVVVADNVVANTDCATNSSSKNIRNNNSSEDMYGEDAEMMLSNNNDSGSTKKLLDGDYALTAVPLRRLLYEDSVMGWFLFVVFLGWPARPDRPTVRGVAIMALYLGIVVVALAALGVLLYSMFTGESAILMRILTTVAVISQVRDNRMRTI